MRRSLMAEAVAPAAISNFFTVHDAGLSRTPPDLPHVGATGGGYMLSRGVTTRARIRRDGTQGREILISVNGDPDYPAITTRLAVHQLLTKVYGDRYPQTELSQDVQVPIGEGFGASAASALSAAMAVASALHLDMSTEEVASFAHSAEVLCRTGLGTVSAIYRNGGAAIISSPGAPGIAKVESVAVPRGLRIVTASLAPIPTTSVLSSPTMIKKVNRLGDDALRTVSDLRLESLVKAGEDFCARLGIWSAGIRHLVGVAKREGALGASQNMVGQTIHALVRRDVERRVSGALARDPLSPEVRVFDFGEPPRSRRIDWPASSTEDE